MRLTISQTALSSLIARGGAVAQKKAIIPALEMVRLTADDAGTLALASSDMDRFAEATIAANVTAPGRILVPHAAIETLIAKHPKTAEISLELDGGVVVVKAGRSRVKLPTLPADTFPGWADEEASSEFDLKGEDFERAFSRVRFAASNDAARYYLQGVCVDATPGDAMHFVATDGHRLALSGMPIPEGAASDLKAIVPSESIEAALKVFKGAASVHITIGKRAIGISADGLRLSARLIEATYPDYQRVIPERGQHPTVTFSRADFVDCLARANVLTGEGAFARIVFTPSDDVIRLDSRNHKGGEASEELSAIFEGNGFQPFGFNPRYAESFLSTLNVGELSIEQSDPEGAHLIFSRDAPDFLGVLLPVRI